jgi:hypothetical protein
MAYYKWHTAYSIQRTAYSIQYTAYSILHTAYCILHTAYCILHTAYCIQHTAYCTLHTAYCIYCVIMEQRRLLCPQTFIVKIFIIVTSATTGFYSKMERRGNRHVAVETERERAWVCVHCEKTSLVSLKNGRLELLVCELLFTTLFIQGLLELREGGEKRKRKKDYEV